MKYLQASEFGVTGMFKTRFKAILKLLVGNQYRNKLLIFIDIIKPCFGKNREIHKLKTLRPELSERNANQCSAKNVNKQRSAKIRMQLLTSPEKYFRKSEPISNNFCVINREVLSIIDIFNQES